jgi:hypothetical protein
MMLDQYQDDADHARAVATELDEQVNKLEAELNRLGNEAAGAGVEASLCHQHIEELEAKLAACQKELAAAQARERRYREAISGMIDNTTPPHENCDCGNCEAKFAAYDALAPGPDHAALDAALEEHGLKLIQSIVNRVEGIDDLVDFDDDVSYAEVEAMNKCDRRIDAALEQARNQGRNDMLQEQVECGHPAACYTSDGERGYCAWCESLEQARSEERERCAEICLAWASECEARAQEQPKFSESYHFDRALALVLKTAAEAIREGNND